MEIEVAADQIEKALGAFTRIHRNAVVARTVIDEDGFVSILLNHVLEFVSDFVESLIPGNPLELALSSLPDTFHRIKQAIFGIDALLNGTTAQTSTHLRLIVTEITGLGTPRIVGFDSDDLLILGHNTNRATAAAVDGACRPRHGFLVVHGFCNGRTQR